MDKETDIAYLDARFNRLSTEKQAEILGMAEAFTYAQKGEAEIIALQATEKNAGEWQ
ncbi:hypothetical protein FACS1894151_01570 [Spirochaetia bacterium]|nr:hypothetical protein FACS1894151_01570 [Spirochaetia bacterium]